jgi:hypothetical protein
VKEQTPPTPADHPRNGKSGAKDAEVLARFAIAHFIRDTAPIEWLAPLAQSEYRPVTTKTYFVALINKFLAHMSVRLFHQYAKRICLYLDASITPDYAMRRCARGNPPHWLRPRTSYETAISIEAIERLIVGGDDDAQNIVAHGRQR